MENTSSFDLSAELDTDRVRRHTAPHVNQRIDAVTRASVADALQGGPEAVARRLVQLEYEWDVDRALMVNFAVAGGASFALGMMRYADGPTFGPRKKGLLYFFGAQLAFLLLHGVAGWCPPASVFRRLGFRTQREIEVERASLREATLGPKALNE
jgi:hypothetical protein